MRRRHELRVSDSSPAGESANVSRPLRVARFSGESEPNEGPGRIDVLVAEHLRLSSAGR